jgi:hypothetical protein
MHQGLTRGTQEAQTQSCRPRQSNSTVSAEAIRGIADKSNGASLVITHIRQLKFEEEARIVSLRTPMFQFICKG